MSADPMSNICSSVAVGLAAKVVPQVVRAAGVVQVV